MNEIFTTKQPVYFNFGNGHVRLAAEIFKYKDDLIFFDVGWTLGFGHPIHGLKVATLLFLNRENGNAPDGFEIRKGGDRA